MARPKNPIPVYKLHSTTGLARCWVNGKWVTLGKYGSPESRAEFARILAELETAPTITPISGLRNAPSRHTIDQVLLAFLAHAELHYRGADGKPTNEYREYKRAIAPLHRLYGHTPADQFGPKALAAVRQEMVKTGLSRKVVNQRIGRVVRAFKWAAGQELIPVSVFQSLRTLTGLQKGRTTAKEREPIRPVPFGHVEATLPFLGEHLRTMIELQKVTGCRPGEICALRLANIDRTGETWIYRPPMHKTSHHGHERVIPFGPKAQALLLAFLATRPIESTAPVFSPFRAREERFTLARSVRKSKVQPSQVNRRKKKPKLVPASEYTAHTYTHAIRVAAEKAGVPHWHPNQLRHTFATEVRRVHGVEAAQVLLGHSKADVTQVYAERNLALALKVAKEIG